MLIARPVVSASFRLLATLCSIVLGALHCGGDEASTHANETGATGAAAAEIRLVDEEISFDNSPNPGSYLTGKCVTAGLPTDARGVPDCVLLVARSASDEPATIPATACESCDWPGQRVPSAATLARARLPGKETGCLCEMIGQPPPVDGDLDKSDFGFCYLKARGDRDTHPLTSHCPENASLGMRGGSLQPVPITLTIACY